MGRHREFELDVALEAALRAFWKKGYEGTSFDDLTKATGVVRPGLYAAFGNKEALFLKALDLYDTKYTAFMGTALKQPTAREVARHVLEGSVNLVTFYPASPGCMSVNGAVGCSDSVAGIRDELVKRRNDAQEALKLRFERARADGDLAADADCAMLAGLLMAVSHGMAVQAKAGLPRSALQPIADHVLSTWPSAGTLPSPHRSITS
ncbi:TetR/AcrR family transcriptional regulator [Rhizobium sp. P38BS-XIX]|uniref:TetR/AcrR family transcriptional regulator n=1 Tax=Rhizobium sp. P38BS-XIX TaxID=2726740 RepID=UPI001456F93A|nr:TetR/AcrR family transcriptional regulator [Rhizobium sp. P38BS-XIX]NLR97177.1 TetR/AcrR family transcriptional regulator [Rhizobium sp. P38BS-XIX]